MDELEKTTGKSKTIKLITWGLGGFVALLLVVMIIAPLVIDVDQYRPQIVRAANENINGKLEIGKLSLSLWGQIRIKVDGFKLSDQNGKDIITVRDAFFHIPFGSVISGSPVLTFKMTNPTLAIEKGSDGKLNLVKLAKATEGKKEESSAAGKAEDSGSGKSEPVAIPNIVAKAALGVEFRDATILYVDKKSEIDNKIDKFNILLKDISLSKPMQIKLWAEMDTKVGKNLRVVGPFEMNGTFQVFLNKLDLEKYTLTFGANMDDISVGIPDVFVKAKGIPASFEMAGGGDLNTFNLKKFQVKFHNAVIDASGKAQGIGSKASPDLDFRVSSNEIDLGGWGKLVVPLREYELTGKMKMNASVSGPSAAMNYNAFLAVEKMTAKAPGLKVKPEINFMTKVKTDEVEKLTFTFSAPKNDLRFTGRITNLSKGPQGVFELASNGINVNELVDLPDPKKAKSAEKSAAGNSGAVGEASGGKGAAGTTKIDPKDDLDLKLDPVRKNDFLKRTAGSLKVNVSSLQVYDIVIDKIASEMTFRDLVFAIKNFEFNVFRGNFKQAMSLDMKPMRPAYSFSSRIKNFDLKSAVTSQLELLKNTLFGVVTINADGKGSSFNPEMAKANLDMKGNLQVVDAKFTSIDVMKMTVDGINESIQKLGEKYPAIKKHKVNKLKGKEGRYELIKSSFSLKSGKFKAPDFYAKAAKDNGVDLDGNTEVGIIDYSLFAKWWVVDRQNMTKARDIGIEEKGIKIEHILAEKGKPVRFPVTVTGKLDSPKYGYGEVPGHFISVAAENTKGAATSKAKKAAGKKAAEVIKKVNAPPAVKKKAEKLLKKFGF